jgi:hypothetical protein
MEHKQTIKVGTGEGQEVQGTYVDLTEKTTIYATAKAPFHKEGAEMVVHPEMAKKFIANGYATEKKGKKE